MQIKVTLDTGGSGAQGLDRRSLEADIEADITDFARYTQSQQPTKERTSPPPGAQGEDILIQWLIELAKDPGMLPVYARSLLFGLNEIARSYRSNVQGSNGEAADEPPFRVRVFILGKEIALPTSVVAIKKAIEEIAGSAS